MIRALASRFRPLDERTRLLEKVAPFVFTRITPPSIGLKNGARFESRVNRIFKASARRFFLQIVSMMLTILVKIFIIATSGSKKRFFYRFHTSFSEGLN